MEIFKKEKTLDGFCRNKTKKIDSDYLLARFAREKKNTSVLFSKHGTTDNFSTSNLYLHHIKSDKKPDFSSLDGFLRFEQKIPFFWAFKNRFGIYAAVKENYGGLKDYAAEIFDGPVFNLSPVKIWNVSIVGALFMGMFLMTFIYRYLGQGAGAASEQMVSGDKTQTELVLGANTQKDSTRLDEDELEKYVTKLLEDYKNESQKEQNENLMEKEMKKMVEGYPIEKMVPYIAKKDKAVAAFMIGIAKQESDWGKHVPVLDGEDCFNYWGYRGKRKRMGTGGHTCFDSPEDAVDTVAKRLEFLVSNEKMTTPDKMVVVWKCGYDCSWDNPANVKRWVNAVSVYFKKLDNIKA